MRSNTQITKNASRRRSDIGWEHGMEVDNDPKKIRCRYCKEIIPGNIYRFKHHLACTNENVKACESVPVEVKMQMDGILKKSSKRKTMNEEKSVPHKKGKRIIESFSNRTIGVTQSILNQNSEKELRDEICQQIVRFFHTSGIPFSCAKNPQFVKMFELVGKCSSEFIPPSYHEHKNTTDMLEKYRYEWKKTGCSIICDEWTDTKGTFYCKFLVNCPKGTIFWESINTSDFSQTTEKVFEVLDEIVEEVGEENVVQVITNNVANYKVAIEMLIEKREKKIFWSPCVVQLLDEILEDFKNNLLHHRITIDKGKKISTFIYSSTKLILMLRMHTGGKDLIGPTATRSASAYLTLLYLFDMKDTLIAMLSLESDELAKEKEGEEIQQIVQIVQDYEFWGDIVDCLNFALPIIEVLLKIYSNEKPTMGFIYEEMNRAEESLKSLNKVKGYETIWKIFNERWNAHVRPLYAPSYLLNPQLQSDATFKFPSESNEGPYTCLARMVIDYHDDLSMNAENLKKIEQQIVDFKNSKGLFGSLVAIMVRHSKDPAEWWDSYGKHCPELQRMAIHLLSLTCSSCRSRQSWNAYEQVYPKKRSCSYQRKLNDLIHVIKNFKSNTPQARTIAFEGGNPEVSSSDFDVLANDADCNFNEGVPLPGNHSGNEVDTCWYNLQPQSAASSTFLQLKGWSSMSNIEFVDPSLPMTPPPQERNGIRLMQ